jgi:hypothetical protein
MRLLKLDDTGQISWATFNDDDNVPPYATLSHRWGDGEVLFKDLMGGEAKSKPGYHKIQFCADQARRDRLQYFWVDTCCIDQTNSVELQSSLNCMFRWYRRAAKCYVYLTDVPSTTFDDSNWFTRGWTLQELIAPKWVEFFTREGERLGDKLSREQDIHRITGIPVKALRGGSLSDFTVSERLAWMDKRETTLPEDQAYSLFGIFDVCIPLLYGERKDKALRRLREEIDASMSLFRICRL